jgi:hypothetical protein
MAWGVDWEAAIGALFGTRQPCLIRGPVYTVQSVAYLGFVKGDLPSLPFPYLPLLPPSLDLSLPSISLPFPFSLCFPLLTGVRGITPGKIFKIADARR